LAHGVCRFDVVTNDILKLDNSDDPKLDRLHYFRGIRTMLKANGFCVHHSKVSWAADVNTRAEDLRINIEEVLKKENAKKVNVIAHSMGGLDSRHMLFNGRSSNKIHERIASLTTISTPHAGSPFADWGIDNLPHVIPAARLLGLDLNALSDLRTDRCMAFNSDPAVVEFEKESEKTIRFQTYAGRQEFWGVFDALKLPFYIIEKREGENDGLVSVKSAKWREHYFKRIIDDTDHLNELGWWEPAQVYAAEGEDQLLKRIHKLFLEIAAGLP
jgi:pimeloyl-ACP methyl ester carboxylesterase